jgi:hypothetical protein
VPLASARRLPFRRVVLTLRQGRDEVADIAQGAELAAIGQRDWIVEGAVPAFVTHRAAGCVPDLTFGSDIKANERPWLCAVALTGSVVAALL